MTRGPLLWVIVLTGQSSVLAGGASEPAALTALRLRCQLLLMEAEAPAHGRWLAALEGQEKQWVAAGDFEGAAILRERRMAVLSGKPDAGSVPSPLKLNAAAARTTTAVDFVDARKEVARFRRAGALIEWELPGQTPGMYEVKLVCGVMGPSDQNELPDPYQDPAVPLPVRDAGAVALALAAGIAGGVVEFRQITSLKGSGALLRRSVRSTGGWSRERALTLGRVELDSKIAKFSLRAVDASPAGLMDFRRIELVPVASAATLADPAGLRELARLREVYQKQFTEQTRSINAKYVRSLGELEVDSAKQRDNDSVAMVRQEKQRIEQGGSTESAQTGKSAARLLPVTEKLYMLVKGEARLTSQGDYLTRMRPAPGCEVTWKLAGLGVTSGTYQVEVECRLTPEHGGTAVLAATTPGGSSGPAMELKVAAPDFGLVTIVTKRRPDGTPGTSLVSTFAAGTVIIPKGSEYLTLRVTSLAVPDGALCDLKCLRLTPGGAASP